MSLQCPRNVPARSLQCPCTAGRCPRADWLRKRRGPDPRRAEARVVSVLMEMAYFIGVFRRKATGATGLRGKQATFASGSAGGPQRVPPRCRDIRSRCRDISFHVPARRECPCIMSLHGTKCLFTKPLQGPKCPCKENVSSHHVPASKTMSLHGARCPCIMSLHGIRPQPIQPRR